MLDRFFYCLFLDFGSNPLIRIFSLSPNNANSLIFEKYVPCSSYVQVLVEIIY
jgi:hypothetical protein